MTSRRVSVMELVLGRLGDGVRRRKTGQKGPLWKPSMWKEKTKTRHVELKQDMPWLDAHMEEGLYTLAKYKKPLFVHAEVVTQSESDDAISIVSDPREEAAIRELQTSMEETKVGGRAEGAHVHIAHKSDAGISLDLLKDAKSSGASVTVETAPHYLSFSAEEIRDGDTRFKCSPPIRDKINRQKLWDSLLEGHIDLLSSDHSPTIPSLKLLEEGDFLRAWGGVSSLQFDLPATWTAGLKYEITLGQLVKWWSEKPAKLAGQEHNKGSKGYGSSPKLSLPSRSSKKKKSSYARLLYESRVVCNVNNGLDDGVRGCIFGRDGVLEDLTLVEKHEARVGAAVSTGSIARELHMVAKKGHVPS
ncbi:hypothetical protein KSP40_PGU011923 [Platanthera guangdongensis]|uniref:Allantoinase n=1 Tax=Platanthera guangdongensis TaxID=2320717 RepID=A0ABR2MQX9_9ASPA